MRLATLLLILLVSQVGSSSNNDQLLQGVVVDAMNQPVAGAVFAVQWAPSSADGSLQPLGPHAITDATGHFSLLAPRAAIIGTSEAAFLVFNERNTQGALVELPAADLSQPLVIRLQPLHSVRYALRTPVPVNTNGITGRIWTQSSAMLGAIRGTDGVLKLPPGRYSLHILLEKVDRQAQPFEVADRDLTLPTLHFALAPIPQHYGHGTPTISTLWDMKNRPFEIGSTKGQWTLLYFWHYTCAPCIQKGIPELADFVSSHRAERNRFRVLAIHVNEGEDWDTFHTHTLMLEKQPWHSVPPFPFIYDKTGRLTADWGIVSFPTVALIDPAGNLVSDGSLQKLDEALATSHAQPDSAQARSR